MRSVLLLVLFSLSASIFAQEKQPEKPSDNKQPDPSQGLDKEYYNAYLDSLPNEKAIKDQTLRQNLYAAIKKIIPREDPDRGPNFLKTLKATDLKYERVSPISPFVRGLLKEVPGLKADKYTYIVKTGPYLMFVAFQVDPGLYITSETQRHLIIRKGDDHTE